MVYQFARKTISNHYKEHTYLTAFSKIFPAL